MSEWKNPIFLDTLAASYAETGDFDAALKWEKKAIELFTGNEVDKARDLLKLYEKHEPMRDNTKYELIYESERIPPIPSTASKFAPFLWPTP